MSRETVSVAPQEVATMLRDLCQWAILQTIQDDAEESEHAQGVGYGFLEAAGDTWDTMLRDRYVTRWRDRMFGFDRRNLLLASPRDLVSFWARAMVIPRENHVRGDPILDSWHSQYADRDVVSTDAPSLITNLVVSRPSSRFMKIAAVYDLDKKPNSFDIARLESMDEFTIEEGLRRIWRLGTALLETVTVRE